MTGHTWDGSTLRLSSSYAVEERASAEQAAFADASMGDEVEELRSRSANTDRWESKRKGSLSSSSSSSRGSHSFYDPPAVASNSDTASRTHTQGGREIFAYGSLATSPSDLKSRYRMSIAALRELLDDGVAAGVYTQISDVEGEVNGLLTYDRKVIKIDPVELNEWHRALFQSFL